MYEAKLPRDECPWPGCEASKPVTWYFCNDHDCRHRRLTVSLFGAVSLGRGPLGVIQWRDATPEELALNEGRLARIDENYKRWGDNVRRKRREDPEHFRTVRWRYKLMQKAKSRAGRARSYAARSGGAQLAGEIREYAALLEAGRDRWMNLSDGEWRRTFEAVTWSLVTVILKADARDHPAFADILRSTPPKYPPRGRLGFDRRSDIEEEWIDWFEGLADRIERP